MLTSDVMNGAATLQDVLGRYELNCSCEDCAHCVRLVTEELIEKFGPEYEIPTLADPFSVDIIVLILILVAAFLFSLIALTKQKSGETSAAIYFYVAGIAAILIFMWFANAYIV